jgi:hypothetical protein
MTTEAEPMKAGASLIAAVLKARGEIKYIQAKGYNKQHKYTYVSESDVLDAVRPAMDNHGLALFPVAVDLQSQSPTDKKRFTTLIVTFLLAHVSGESQILQMSGEGFDTLDKSPGKAHTSVMKALLRQLFLVSTGDHSMDTEFDGYQMQQGQPMQQQWQQPPPQQGYQQQPPMGPPPQQQGWEQGPPQDLWQGPPPQQGGPMPGPNQGHQPGAPMQGPPPQQQAPPPPPPAQAPPPQPAPIPQQDHGLPPSGPRPGPVPPAQQAPAPAPAQPAAPIPPAPPQQQAPSGPPTPRDWYCKGCGVTHKSVFGDLSSCPNCGSLDDIFRVPLSAPRGQMGEANIPTPAPAPQAPVQAPSLREQWWSNPDNAGPIDRLMNGQDFATKHIGWSYEQIKAAVRDVGINMNDPTGQTITHERVNQLFGIIQNPPQ